MCQSGSEYQPLEGQEIRTERYDGVDLAKRVFQVHWVEVETGEIKRKTLARAQVLGFSRVVPSREARLRPRSWTGVLSEGLPQRFRDTANRSGHSD